MNKFKFKVVLLGLGLQIASVVLADAAPKSYKISPKAGDVEFLATGKPGFLKIKGTKASMSGEAKITGTQVTGEFEVALDQFDTGIEMRDEHMKKNYLETSKFPKAVLKLSPMPLDLNGASGSKNVTFQGDLTLHGVTKQVQGDADLEWSEKAVQVKGRFTIQLSDFKIDIPSYLGVKVADSVAVTTDFTTQRP